MSNLNEKELLASYPVALHVTRTGKPHSCQKLDLPVFRYSRIYVCRPRGQKGQKDQKYTSMATDFGNRHNKRKYFCVLAR